MKYLEWKDKKYPIRVTMSALGDVQDEFGIGPDELDDVTTTPKLLRSLMKYSLLEGADMTDTEFTLTDKEIRMMFNDEYFKLVPLIMDFFQEVAAGMEQIINPKTKIRKKVYGK